MLAGLGPQIVALGIFFLRPIARFDKMTSGRRVSVVGGLLVPADPLTPIDRIAPRRSNSSRPPYFVDFSGKHAEVRGIQSLN